MQLQKIYARNSKFSIQKALKYALTGKTVEKFN